MAAVDSTTATMVGSGKATEVAKADKKNANKDLQKTKLCVYFLEGKCGYGTKCTFAHSLVDIKSVPDLTKTQLCAKFAEGKCTNKNCTFAHGEAELRDPPNFKKKMCKWYSKGKCRNGANCGFAHEVRELRMEAPPGLDTKVDTKKKVGPPPGLTKMAEDFDCDASTDVPSSQAETDISSNGAASIPEEHIFRFNAARGSAPLKQQVDLMGSAIGGLQAKLASLEDMMLQQQVMQMQQQIEELTQQCWALESGICMSQVPVVEPTPPKSRLSRLFVEPTSRLSAKAQPFKPTVEAWSEDSTSVGSE